MKGLSRLKISLLLSILIIQLVETSTLKQLENQIDRVDNKILNYGRIDFLNQNLNNLTKYFGSRSTHDIFDIMKIRKFSTAKIDVTSLLKKIQQRKVKAQSQKQNKNSKINSKEEFIQNLNVIPTVGLVSKKFQGLNTYSHMILHSLNKFYSFQGQNIFNLPQKNKNERLNDEKWQISYEIPQIMISSSRNENFYIAQYGKDYSVRQNANCLNIKVSQVQMKNKQFNINRNPPYNNFLIETNQCNQHSIDENVLYQNFFTYGIYQSKPSHYIFSNRKQVNFYIYSEIAEQLVMDQIKTIKITQIFRNPQQEIKTIVKVNTHLIILTNNNNLLSVNLNSLLSSKKPKFIIFYETISIKFQELHSVKFNDNDFRYFYVLSDRNIYQYKLFTQKILRKYPLQYPSCQSQILSKSCTQNIWVLQNYILVQQKFSLINSYSSNLYSLIEKSSGSWYQFHLPFSHENKCSQLKTIFVSKNKNSHYIVTLACLIQQKTNLSNSTQINPISEYLILQHLNLQTSTQIYSSGQMGGIDFSKFRLPMILFSIGLVCYITVKRSSKKSPQKIAKQQQLQKKFEQEVLSTIRRQKQRQEALNLARKKT